MKKKIYLYFRQVGIKFDLINHYFKLEFVDSGLYFVQDENDFINPLLQVGSGSNEKSNGFGSGSGGPKINGSDRIQILIPDICVIQNLFLFNSMKMLENVKVQCPTGQHSLEGVPITLLQLQKSASLDITKNVLKLNFFQ